MDSNSNQVRYIFPPHPPFFFLKRFYFSQLGLECMYVVTYVTNVILLTGVACVMNNEDCMKIPVTGIFKENSVLFGFNSININ